MPPSADNPKDPHGGLTIQVAAVKQVADADQLVATLKQKGYPAYRMAALKGQDTWYRVRVGAFKTRAEAKKMLKRLQKDNHKGFLINRGKEKSP